MEFWFPKFLTEVKEELRPAIETQADADQINLILKSGHMYPAMLLTLAMTTGIYGEHPPLMWAVTLCIGVGLFSRFYLLAARKKLYPVNPRLWRLLFAGTVFFMSLACGVLFSRSMVFYGFEHWTSIVQMFWILGLSTGSVLSFVPNKLLRLINLLPLLGPSIVVAVASEGSEGGAIAFALIVFVTFLLQQGNRLHTAYWQQLIDQSLKEERNRELEAARQSAEAANRSKSQFLANMSHEIRTPMHGILATAELVLGTPLTPVQRDHLRMLNGSAEGLLRVLNDVLDISKIEAGKLSLESIPFEVRAIIEEVRSILLPQVRSKGLKLECRVAPEVPAAICGDPVRLRQVLLNLAGNAVKFTKDGSITILVESRVTAHQPPDPLSAELQFRVVDTGIGIPEEKQKAIFDAFSQADETITRHFGGTGLGLSISSQLVGLMGGKISVESVPGRGSDFSFHCRFDVPLEFHPEESLPETSRVGLLRILIAEDNPVNQMIAARILSAKGHVVELASTGLEAVTAARRVRFDLILMDNQMPELTGLEATRIIRERDPGVPIIGLSADAMIGDRERFLAAGMNGYVSKPFKAKDLHDAIAACIADPSVPAQVGPTSIVMS